MVIVGALLPEINGLMPLIFVIVLVLLAGAVGLFALFLLLQQFRNPARRTRRV
jgi:hypothetical protein